MSMCSLLLCGWKTVFAMTSVFSWQNSVSLFPASFCSPWSNLPVTPCISWLPTFAFQFPITKKTSFFLVLVLEHELEPMPWEQVFYLLPGFLNFQLRQAGQLLLSPPAQIRKRRSPEVPQLAQGHEWGGTCSLIQGLAGPPPRPSCVDKRFPSISEHLESLAWQDSAALSWLRGSLKAWARSPWSRVQPEPLILEALCLFLAPLTPPTLQGLGEMLQWKGEKRKWVFLFFPKNKEDGTASRPDHSWLLLGVCAQWLSHVRLFVTLGL